MQINRIHIFPLHIALDNCQITGRWFLLLRRVFVGLLADSKKACVFLTDWTLYGKERPPLKNIRFMCAISCSCSPL